MRCMFAVAHELSYMHAASYLLEIFSNEHCCLGKNNFTVVVLIYNYSFT